MVLVLSLSGCETWEKDLEVRKIEVLEETFFLPDASQTTVEGSFRLCDTVNPHALSWINSIYDASSAGEVLRIFQNFQDSFNISKASPSWEEFESIHNKVKELAVGASTPYLVKRQAAFLLAGYLHRFYLRNAGTLRKKLKYLEPIYKRTMEGDIPDCVSRGKSTWHPAIYPIPWAIFAAIILLLFRALIRSFRKPAQLVFKTPKPAVTQKTTPKPPSPIPPVKPALSKLYAGLPSGNILARLSTKFEPQTTYFIIEINPIDQTRGKLSLVEDQATLLHAFSMIDTLRDTCELRSTGAPKSLDQLTKNIPGEVVLEKGLWKITKKIMLEWSDSPTITSRVKEDKPKPPIPKMPPTPQQPKEKIEPPLPKAETIEKPPENQKAPPEVEAVPLQVVPETKVKPPQEPTRVYARMPAGSTFYQLSDYFQPNETFFVFSIFPDDPKTASISLTDDPETLEYFLTRELTHQNVCEFPSDGKPSVENVQEIEHGSAKLTSDYWTLKTCIKLDW